VFRLAVVVLATPTSADFLRLPWRSARICAAQKKKSNSACFPVCHDAPRETGAMVAEHSSINDTSGVEVAIMVPQCAADAADRGSNTCGTLERSCFVADSNDCTATSDWDRKLQAMYAVRLW
jgi:hypothetical protein